MLEMKTKTNKGGQNVKNENNNNQRLITVKSFCQLNLKSLS